MQWGILIPVVAIVASSIGWIVTTWIRAKHGYPVENEWSGMTGKSDPAAERQISLLSAENGELKAQMLRMEERIAVLERIATDPATRIAREIDTLR